MRAIAKAAKIGASMKLENFEKLLREEVDDVFFNKLVKIVSAYPIGDYIEIAGFIKEIAMMTGRAKPVLPAWPDYEGADEPKTEQT